MRSPPPRVALAAMPALRRTPRRGFSPARRAAAFLRWRRSCRSSCRRRSSSDTRASASRASSSPVSRRSRSFVRAGASKCLMIARYPGHRGPKPAARCLPRLRARGRGRLRRPSRHEGGWAFLFLAACGRSLRAGARCGRAAGRDLVLALRLEIGTRGYRSGERFVIAPRPAAGAKRLKDETLIALVALVLILAIFGGLGFAVHVLWYVLIVAVLLWLIGFFIGGAPGGRRWYGRW